jgi:hypothetical protein
VVQGSIEALSWLTAWRMIAAPIRRRILLISAAWTLPAARLVEPRRMLLRMANRVWRHFGVHVF